MSEDHFADPLIGTLVAEKYRIEKQIARGGMGTVYLAIQEPLGRKVAVKLLRHALADPELKAIEKARFLREARVISQLSDPHTVTIYDYGTLPDGGLYFVMEFLEGKTLAKLLALRRYLPCGEVIHIVQQICRSLAEAHSCGLVHRDLKPLNVMLIQRSDDERYVKVLDFGLVKPTGETEDERVTKQGALMGSPSYMAPEQVFDEKVDARTDIYSLGVIMYELLTGVLPFRGKSSAREVLRSHVLEAPEPMDQARPAATIPRLLNLAVMRCLEKQPNDRFDSVGALLRVLEDIPLGSESEDETFAPDAFAPADDGASELTEAYEPMVMTETTPERVVDTSTVDAQTKLTDAPPRARAQGSRAGAFVAIGLLVTALSLVIVLMISHDPNRGMSLSPKNPKRTTSGATKSAKKPNIPSEKRTKSPLKTAAKVTATPPKPATKATPKPGTQPTPKSAPAVASTRSAAVRVTLTSKPDGAEVRHGGKILGKTPLTTEATRANFPLRFELKLKGHHTKTYVFPYAPEAATEKISAHVSLERIAKRAKRRSKKRKTTPRKTTPRKGGVIPKLRNTR